VNKYFKLGFALILSLAGLYFAFKGESLVVIIEQLRNVNLIGIIIATILLLVSCIIRAYRWKILLLPFGNIDLHTVYGSTMIGYFGNSVLVFRLGELLKAHSVVKGENIEVSQAFGTVILERILDLLAVFFIVILLAPWFPFSDKNMRFGVFAISTILIIIITVIVLIQKTKFISSLKKKTLSRSPFTQKILLSIERLFEGLMVITKTNKTFTIFFTTVLLWFIYFVVSIITLYSCKINLGIVSTGILLALGSIAIGIPALPGSAGTYDAGIKYGLIYLFNIDSGQALNYAIISHALAYFPFLIVGLIYFLFSNISFKDLK